ncbi:MAG: 50S ribosomal protein L24 [Clostridia bacterium]|nr:50S ribosomal protein L24 [Clostridia bacterium]
MMKMTIKTGDNVLVIAGKDKGKTGKVVAVNAAANKVLVENVNVVTKHQKPRSQQDKGGIVKKSAPIEASNVQVVCPVCGKATRVAHGEVDGKKVRTCKKCNASLDKEYVKASKKEAKKSTVKASELKGAKLKAATAETAEEAPKKTTKKSTAKKVSE